jgi:hypothetical protein
LIITSDLSKPISNLTKIEPANLKKIQGRQKSKSDVQLSKMITLLTKIKPVSTAQTQHYTKN